ncbi:MAG TPA: alpha/beta hydrolase [Streptosporangiaceae bacterium]
MVLLHGSGPGVAATANWRPVIPAISTEHRVIAPDHLGFGGTATGEPVTYGRAAWTQHALALLDTLGSCCQTLGCTSCRAAVTGR